MWLKLIKAPSSLSSSPRQVCESKIAEDGRIAVARGRAHRHPTSGPGMEHLNCSGLPFHAALQASVAQGLVNRAGGRVWLSDLAEGLGEAGQQVCANCK